MGTRSITNICNASSLGGGVVCTFYRGFDGDPSGHGKDLADWLKDKNIVNGINSNFRKGIDFNGTGNMSIHLMAHIAHAVTSSIEVVTTGSSGYGEDYIYNVRFDNGSFQIDTIDPGNKKLISMMASSYDHEEIDSYLYG